MSNSHIPDSKIESIEEEFQELGGYDFLKANPYRRLQICQFILGQTAETSDLSSLEYSNRFGMIVIKPEALILSSIILDFLVQVLGVKILINAHSKISFQKFWQLYGSSFLKIKVDIGKVIPSLMYNFKTTGVNTIIFEHPPLINYYKFLNLLRKVPNLSNPYDPQSLLKDGIIGSGSIVEEGNLRELIQKAYNEFGLGDFTYPYWRALDITGEICDSASTLDPRIVFNGVHSPSCSARVYEHAAITLNEAEFTRFQDVASGES